MVQDTAGSHEVYRGILPGNNLGGWGLAEEYEGEDDGSGYLDYVMEEKTSLWTVSVPGETEWIAQVKLSHLGARSKLTLLTPWHNLGCK